MGREQDLERQLADCKQARNQLLNKLSDVFSSQDAPKRFWDAVAPIVKANVERRVNDGAWDDTGVRCAIFEKSMAVLCGDNWRDLLEKL